MEVVYVCTGVFRIQPQGLYSENDQIEKIFLNQIEPHGAIIGKQKLKKAIFIQILIK